MITKTEPMKQQRLAVLSSFGKPSFAYFMDPGLGKTKALIDEAYNLYLEERLSRVVVICPKSIMSVWEDEIHTHCIAYSIYKWSNKIKQFECRHYSNKGLEFFIINIDVIHRFKDAVISIGANMVVIDESTSIKKTSSKRTLAAMDIGEHCEFRRILTGTPIANTPLDIYGQMAFLDYQILKGWSYETFKLHICEMGGFKNREVMGYKNLDDMVEMITPYCFRASKEEYMSDLPPRTTQIREIELTSTSWKAYKTIVEEVAIELGDNPMITDQVIKKITKLRQLTGGWILDDDRNVINIGHEKLSELVDLLCECQGQKILIWCQFKHEIDMLYKLIPNSEKYYGDTSESRRTEVRNEFNFGDLDILIIQNDTGSEGLTLNAATVSIFYSNPSYPKPKIQARERNHRKGQTKPVTEYELLVRGSIDETEYNSIINRVSLADSITTAINSADGFKEIMFPKPRVDWKASSRIELGDRPW